MSQIWEISAIQLLRYEKSKRFNAKPIMEMPKSELLTSYFSSAKTL